MASANGGPSQYGEKDLVTGKCLTCDSLVRWPRQLDVFRCTVCLMVNDLKPATPLSVEVRSAEAPDHIEMSSKQWVSRRGGIPSSNFRRVSDPTLVPFLSLERTRKLIDECMTLYLRSRLEHGFHPVPGFRNGQDIQERSTCPLPTLPIRSDFDNSNVEPVVHTLPSPSRAPPPPPQNILPDVTKVPPESSLQLAQDSPRSIFRPLENYVIACFSSIECLNTSFLTPRSLQLTRAASDGATSEKCASSRPDGSYDLETPFPEMDAKTLLLGDFAENGMWWTGRSHIEQHRSQNNVSKVSEGSSGERLNVKSPRINWAELDEWYRAVISAGRCWRNRLRRLQEDNSLDEKETVVLIALSAENIHRMEEDVADACAHVQRTLLKATETLLRRPGRPLKSPEDCRFLLILLANPMLYSSDSGKATYLSSVRSETDMSHGQTPVQRRTAISTRQPSLSSPRSPSFKNGNPGKHSSILKRILGLMSNLPSDCHHHLVNWFSRFSEAHFRRLVDLVGSFVTYRLSRQHGRKRSNSHDLTGGLIPTVSGPGAGSSAQLHAALGTSATPKTPDKSETRTLYGEDWQIKAAARIMSLLFSANNLGSPRPQDATQGSPSHAGRTRAYSSARSRAHRHRQLLQTSAFYNTFLDFSDLVADFETWESRRGKFSFCQYPMFLSIWAKIRIMEHDARRQMEIKAREAFFNSIMSRKAISQYLVLKVRRDCLVEDSLRGVSEVVGTGQEEIKKGLRIEFLGEEGLDSGGLRKEWFLLLVREVFDPEHGLFVYDEDSHYCYFNPNTFETSDQFFLVGVLLGLAIYNSTILDVALPPFAFRKLLASAPNYTGPTTSSSRPTSGYTLDDLAEFRPSLAQGLQQLLDFGGDVEETFCRDFVAVVDRYGQPVQVLLCPNGDKRVVTNSNRHEFVDLYIRYLLDISVARQYEPFKRGFFTVCGGNALSLFRPEEIELLVRGSDEPLDVATLRTVAIYDGWGKAISAADEPVVTWFWEAFAKANAKDQRKLLSFITSSDRIPAMGATSLVIKIMCLGNHSNRYPIARTCFNMLGLYRYDSREILEHKLWTAVVESEGFGMK